MLGWIELQPGLGLLVEALDGGGVGDEPLAEDLDGDRLAARRSSAAVDAGEGPLGDVEEDLAAAEEEAAQVALAELVDLPARQLPLRSSDFARASNEPSSASAMAS